MIRTLAGYSLWKEYSSEHGELSPFYYVGHEVNFFALFNLSTFQRSAQCLIINTLLSRAILSGNCGIFTTCTFACMKKIRGLALMCKGHKEELSKSVGKTVKAFLSHYVEQNKFSSWKGVVINGVPSN